MRKAHWLVGLSISAAMIPALAQTSATHYSLQIERQSLVATLRELSKQTGLQLVGPIDEDLAHGGPIVGPLRGEYTAEAALSELLSQSQLGFKRINDRTIAIVGRNSTKLEKFDSRNASFMRLSSAETLASEPRKKLAQAPSTGGSRGVRSEPQSDNVEEVLVTGTYIRGSGPVGSPVKVYTRENMLRTGSSTVDQFARHITENFSNNDLISNPDSSASRFAGSIGSQNIYGGAAFNLRGLGPSATLTLINGSRMAAAGHTGGITDISQIPLSAVERIEILVDGASALYGADAVAGVVNMIMRDDYEGAESSISYGGATEGGARQLTASQLFGTSWDGGNALINYQYTDNDGLDAARRDYIPALGGAHSLMPASQGNSFFGAGSQSLGPGTKLNATVLWGERDTNSQSFLNSDIYTSSSRYAHDVSNLTAILGLEQEIHNDWVAKLTGNYSRVKQSTAGYSETSITDPSLLTSRTKSDLQGVHLLFSGSLARLRSGAVKAALGASYREDSFANFTQTTSGGFSAALGSPKLERQIGSAFAELRVPVWSDRFNEKSLQASVAVRYDDYDDVGSSTNYKIGLEWELVNGVNLRTTYGTSFRAPLLADLGSATNYYAFAAVDGGGGAVNVIQLSGGNPKLKPEEADSFTAGIDLTSALVPNLQVGITYFAIDFNDRIEQPPISGNFFTNPIAAPFVTLNPSLSDVQKIFAEPTFLDFVGATPDSIVAIYDPRIANLASTRQSGIDLSTTYTSGTELGEFVYSLSAEHLLKNDIQTLPGQPSVTFMNRFGQPSKWKGRAGVAWTRNEVGASLQINYINSYLNGLGATTDDPGSLQRIDAFTTADINFTYTPGTSAMAALRGTTVSVSVNNLTDERPPFAEIPDSLLFPGERVLAFDAANASPMGRFVSLQVSKRW